MLFHAIQNREKAMRWLGFLQGAFWADGVFCVTDLMFHNRMLPVPPKTAKPVGRPRSKAFKFPTPIAAVVTKPTKKTFKNIGFNYLGDMPSGVFVTFTSINPREADALPVFSVKGEYRVGKGSNDLVKRRIVCVRQAPSGPERVDDWVPVIDKLNLCELVE